MEGRDGVRDRDGVAGTAGTGIDAATTGIDGRDRDGGPGRCAGPGWSGRCGRDRDGVAGTVCGTGMGWPGRPGPAWRAGTVAGARGGRDRVPHAADLCTGGDPGRVSRTGTGLAGILAAVPADAQRPDAPPGWRSGA
jgi:hypothetical protein